jgi:hypothetical protein
LIGGTDAMRAAGELYLPREPKESREAYQNRLSRSVLYNAFNDTVQKMVGKPFGKPLTLLNTTPEKLKLWSNNIDRAGSNITTFCRNVFQSGLIDGLTHVLVDFPLSAPGQTLADEQAQDIRPYTVHVKASDLIAWQTKTVSGVKQLTQIRIRETETEPDGLWGEKQVERIRVIYPDRYELYQKAKRNQWSIVEQGEISLGRIPLLTFYTNKTGFMTATPPLLDLAHLNVQHWQTSSDQEHILHFIRFPLLHGAGFANDQQQIDIGPNRMIISEDANAKLTYVEHTGAAVEAGRQAIKDLEEKMEAIGMHMLTRRPGDATATAAALDTASSHSSLQDMVRRLENTMEQVFKLMAEWGKLSVTDAGGVDINEDFGLSLASTSDADTLLKSRLAGEISRKSYLIELQRRGTLRDDMDIDEEITETETEDTREREAVKKTEPAPVDTDA